MVILENMEDFISAHYFSLPTQGNIYSTVNLPLTNGTNKSLVTTLKRKVFSCEFVEENNAVIPICKEVPFTYIPSGAEIISIDAFNRSQTYDDFFVGITIVKVNGDHQSTGTYLNIYTEQEVDEKTELSLDSLAQNCLILELNFIPYQLYHTLLIDSERSSEVVWLLSGGDLKVHLFREDPLNHTYCEIGAEELFPEFTKLSSIVLWVDIKYTNHNMGRLTAFGCECGTLHFYYVDIVNNTILMNLSKQFDAPISKVALFELQDPKKSYTTLTFSDDKKLGGAFTENKINCFNLLVVNTLQPSVIFMDIVHEKFKRAIELPDSEKYDAALSASVIDINMDLQKEIIIGTYAKMLLVYTYECNEWKLQGYRKLPHSIHSIIYVDLTGDGVKELIVVTMLGISIFQHDLETLIKKVKSRLRINRSLFSFK